MSKELDIDKKIEIWLPAFISASRGEKSICPRCGSDNVNVCARRCGDDGDQIGYVLITCNDCNKSGCFSRVDFSNYRGIIEEL